MRLWKFNTTTGLWEFQRSVTNETAEQWLGIFQKYEPNARFKIAKHKPKSL